MTENKKKILVVEDEVAMLNALIDKLTSEEFAVIGAKNGAEGLAMALKEHPDLILLDIIMPHMNGIAMMKSLRSDPWGRKVPVVILTNLNPDNNTIKAVEDYHPSFYLVKADWNINDLAAKIREFLGMSHY